ncbi:MAG: ABC transporter ATP-binding protein [Lachnospiraceae bacterium]|jgi:ATP-binding cassette subfamily B protein|nr:ABC transporter ATP-binding protein [Lachnospiraceae bacterium]
MAKRNTFSEDEQVQQRPDLAQFGKVLKYVYPYRSSIALSIVFMLVASATSMVSPLLLKRIINDVVKQDDYRDLVLMIAGMALLALLEIFVTLFQQRIMGTVGHEAIAKIRQEVFYKLQKLPFEYFDSRPDGKIVVRVTDYVNDLANFFTNQLIQLFIYIVKLVMAIIFMLVISPPLTLVVLLAVGPMMACIMKLRKTVRGIFPTHRAKVANRTAFLIEVIMGEKIIKNFNRSEESKKTYMGVHMESVNTWMKIVRLNELNTPIVMLFWNLGMLALYGISLLLIKNGNSAVTAGTVVVFTSYMSLFSGPLTQIASIIQQLAQTSSNLERVFDTLEQPLEIEDEENANVLDHIKGRVDFDHVYFEYEENAPVLKDFDLHVEPGQTIALVGPTGAGKSTVINLLTRFYDVKQGAVRIDGIDVRNVTLESLRREVGVLMQDPFIFKGTIIENIRYGKPSATDEECIRAAELIHADEHIRNLSDGYNHILQERGQGLSAGQKQLISFARIILKNPSVVILDEATSSIDTETEGLIQQALAYILKNKTAFVVAHRLSTVRNADRILYISNYGIAESGTHEELMKLNGLYAALNKAGLQEEN